MKTEVLALEVGTMQVDRHISIKSNGGFLVRIDTQRNPEKDDQPTRPQKGGSSEGVALDQRGAPGISKSEVALQFRAPSLTCFSCWLYLLHSILPS